jgi:DNA transformation protein
MDADFIHELFAPFGAVTVKPMFGGIGIYAEGLMFALAFDSTLYLRVDAASIPDFEREGSMPFVYPLAKHHVGRPSRNFWRLPERLYDDPDALADWARRALAIAQYRKTAPRQSVARVPAKPVAANKPGAKKPGAKKPGAKAPASRKKSPSRRPAR